MLNRSILNFYLGLGLPAAALIATLTKITNRAIAPLTVFALVFMLTTILITIQKITDFKSRFLLAVGPIAIAFLTQTVAASLAAWNAGIATPAWVYGLRVIVPIAAGTLLALAVAAISLPWAGSNTEPVR